MNSDSKTPRKIKNTAILAVQHSLEKYGPCLKQLAEGSAALATKPPDAEQVIKALASALQQELGDGGSVAQEYRTILAAIRAAYNAGARVAAESTPDEPRK